jgi:quercetin dioxygenase-like cupin family protein
MELKPVGTTAKAPAQLFTGDVYLTMIYDGQDPSRMNVALVRFTPGSRSNWHRHAVGQTLHVSEGIGLVGTRTQGARACGRLPTSACRSPPSDTS